MLTIILGVSMMEPALMESMGSPARVQMDFPEKIANVQDLYRIQSFASI